MRVNTTPQTQFTATPLVTSSGSGTVTSLVETGVPEAETYVAGLALLGMAGYGYYHRSVRA